ncbi:MAG: hypothetical protein AAF585_28345, partial [Verrucomicrobiota bacterium]
MRILLGLVGAYLLGCLIHLGIEWQRVSKFNELSLREWQEHRQMLEDKGEPVTLEQFLAMNPPGGIDLRTLPLLVDKGIPNHPLSSLRIHEFPLSTKYRSMVGRPRIRPLEGPFLHQIFGDPLEGERYTEAMACADFIKYVETHRALLEAWRANLQQPGVTYSPRIDHKMINGRLATESKPHWNELTQFSRFLNYYTQALIVTGDVPQLLSALELQSVVARIEASGGSSSAVRYANETRQILAMRTLTALKKFKLNDEQLKQLKELLDAHEPWKDFQRSVRFRRIELFSMMSHHR